MITVSAKEYIDYANTWLKANKKDKEENSQRFGKELKDGIELLTKIDKDVTITVSHAAYLLGIGVEKKKKETKKKPSKK